MKGFWGAREAKRKQETWKGVPSYAPLGCSGYRPGPRQGGTPEPQLRERRLSQGSAGSGQCLGQRVRGSKQNVCTVFPRVGAGHAHPWPCSPRPAAAPHFPEHSSLSPCRRQLAAQCFGPPPWVRRTPVQWGRRPGAPCGQSRPRIRSAGTRGSFPASRGHERLWRVTCDLSRRPPELSEQPLHPGRAQQDCTFVLRQQPPTDTSPQRLSPAPLPAALLPQQPVSLHHGPERPRAAAAAPGQPPDAVPGPRSASGFLQTAVGQQPAQPLSCRPGEIQLCTEHTEQSVNNSALLAP